MKKMKKIMCLLLAVVMVMGMSMTVFAAEAINTDKYGTEYVISVPEESKDDHVYAVYQIFAGDFSDGKLSNVVWGASAKCPNGVEAGKPVDTEILKKLEGTEGDTAVLEVLKEYENFSKGAEVGTVSKSAPLNVPGGYYLIKDNDNVEKITGEDAATLYVVKVVGDTTINRKADHPTVDKDVSDDNGGWVEATDHAINESFQFKLTATVPAGANIAAYDHYKLVFNDTMSAGVTFDGIESVEANDEEIEYTLSDNAAVGEKGLSWSLTIEDLKAQVGDEFGVKEIKVVVIYNAHLNENAIVHNSDANVNEGNGNNNKVYLEFTNNPNSEGTGETKEDHVWVFSFKVDNNKVKDEPGGDALVGAGFKLYDEEENKVELIFDTGLKAYRPIKDDEPAADELTSQILEEGGKAVFNIVGLEQGTYTLKETTTPAGYNTCEDITITISAETNEAYDGESANLTIKDPEGLDNEVINVGGSTLPETGGIGTTIFYVLGGILVLGCGVVLVTRKRVSK